MTLIVIRETVPEKTWAAAFPGGDKSYWLSQTCLISPRQAIFGILSSAEKPAWNAWGILKWRQKKQPFWKILSAVITAALALFLNAWHRNGQSVIQYYYHSLSLLFKVELLHSFERFSSLFLLKFNTFDIILWCILKKRILVTINRKFLY